MNEKLSVEEISQLASQLRIDALKMIEKAGNGHPGGSLSAMDIIATLYSGELKFDPESPDMKDRDRFILSKGHGVPALYATMARKGFFGVEELDGFRQLGSRLQGHPSNAILPGIEASTGSLGQGLSVAHGIAMAAALDGSPEVPAYRVYCLLGDGEIQEGQVWEAAMSAPHHGLHHLTAIVDYNKAQIDGLVEDVMPLEDLVAKWQAFGWHVLRIDGHDIQAIREAFDAARQEQQKPTAIIADTVKGKGVSFMESDLVGWHGKAPNETELEASIRELQSEQEGTSI